MRDSTCLRAAAVASADDWFPDNRLMWEWHVLYSVHALEMWGWPSAPLPPSGSPRWDT